MQLQRREVVGRLPEARFELGESRLGGRQALGKEVQPLSKAMAMP